MLSKDEAYGLLGQIATGYHQVERALVAWVDDRFGDAHEPALNDLLQGLDRLENAKLRLQAEASDPDGAFGA